MTAATDRLAERHEEAKDRLADAAADLKATIDAQANGASTMRSVNARRRDYEAALDRERELFLRLTEPRPRRS